MWPTRCLHTWYGLCHRYHRIHLSLMTVLPDLLWRCHRRLESIHLLVSRKGSLDNDSTGSSLLGTFSRLTVSPRLRNSHGAVVTASVVSFCVAEQVSENVPDNLVNPPFCHNVQQTMYCMTLVTTAIATGLICYKTWWADLVYLTNQFLIGILQALPENYREKLEWIQQ